MREITYRDALNEALREEMEKDPKVFIMGEDVAIYGGAYSVTKGLYEKFGAERVRDTAISEPCIVGAGIGAALLGMRPVCEIMYVDFTSMAMDQIANQMAKIRYMFGGKAKVPMVLRTEGGTGRGIAAQHSQSLEAWFVHVPGLWVVMPSTPYDAKGLLKASIRNDNPIVFIEHKMLYGTKGQVPEEEYVLPIGKADVKKEGKDVTVVTYSRMVLFALEAAKQLESEGISVEVVDLRTLKPMDTETVSSSVRKTGRVLVVYEGYQTCGAGAEIVAKIVEKDFDYLNAPVRRLGGADVPVPMSPPLEKAATPQKEDIVRVVRELME